VAAQLTAPELIQGAINRLLQALDLAPSKLVNYAATLLLFALVFLRIRPLKAFLPGPCCWRRLRFGGTFPFFVCWLGLCLRARFMLVTARFRLGLFAPGRVLFALSLR